MAMCQQHPDFGGNTRLDQFNLHSELMTLVPNTSTVSDDADHLMAALEQQYTVSKDWAGERYCGLTLDWDYNARTCDISMPG